MDAFIKIKEDVKDEKDLLETVRRRVSAIIPEHKADFSFQNGALIISLDEETPAQKNCQIVEIANGALMERLHPCEEV